MASTDAHSVSPGKSVFEMIPSVTVNWGSPSGIAGGQHVHARRYRSIEPVEVVVSAAGQIDHGQVVALGHPEDLGVDGSGVAAHENLDEPAPLTTWLLVTAMPLGSMMNPEPLPPPSNSPKSGVTKLPVETIWMVARGRSSTVVTNPSGTLHVVRGRILVVVGGSARAVVVWLSAVPPQAPKTSAAS